MSKQTSTPSQTSGYSAFWPVFLVFATLAFVQGYHIRGTLNNRESISNSRAQIESLVERSKTVSQTVENVGRELMALSDGKTNEAAKIIAEFQIQIQEPKTNAPAR